MTSHTNNPTPSNNDSSRKILVAEFVHSSTDYYHRQFVNIGNKAGFCFTFNIIAALLGPIWFGMRGLWNWGLPFVIIETMAVVQLGRGLFGDLGADARQRIVDIEGTLNFRREQLQSAIEKQTDKVEVFERAIVSLETAIADIAAEVTQAEASAAGVALSGFAILIAIKIVEGVIANSALEKRFSQWLSNKNIRAGLSTPRTAVASGFVFVVFAVSTIHFAFPGALTWLSTFPTDPQIRLSAISSIETTFDFIKRNGRVVFESLSLGIRVVLDYLEIVFVSSPWPVVASFIIMLTWLSAGVAASVAAGMFLAYMGLFGFWEKAMTTLALLGTAAMLSICIGIPLGLFCARRPRVYSVIRPIMDFMQTMPSFVFMIPVIAFFSVGKPAAVITTMIFGGTPVVRLTVLGMRGVPESIREAAIAFGASRWYLLTKVDLPLAAPSILAGVNQTIMLSLAMVVVASLIGAKGLGEDVLEALQYSSVGQGILAGFAILFCAMILNRVVQGKTD